MPTSGAKARPEVPHKSFMTAKKEPQHNYEKIEKISRPKIVSPSALKNRSFVQAPSRPSQGSKENQKPPQGILLGLYREVEGNSFDSFEQSDDINRSRESDDYACFNSSKLMNEETGLRDSYESCKYSAHNSSMEQHSLNFSRKNSSRHNFEDKYLKTSRKRARDEPQLTFAKEETQLTFCQDLSSISMTPGELASSIESVTSSLQSVSSKRERPSISFQKKFEYYRKKPAPVAPRKMQLDEFVLVDEMGEGKYGKVYMAQHRASGFLCALKAVSKARIREENIEEPFIREIKIQMYLNHPNIVKLYGFFADEENIYLVLECCVSGPLLRVMKDKKIFEESEIIETISDVFEAVSFIHCHGVIHRDLKPENIVIQNVLVIRFRGS